MAAAPEHRWLWRVLGSWLGVLVHIWARTWRVHWIDAPPRERAVYAFWHGQQMALVAARRRTPLTTLVSLSRDGELQASVMRRLGLRVVRGSSTSGGARGLRGMVRAVRAGSDAAFAVDGPRGPAYRAKPGALVVGELGRARVVPLASAARHAWVLQGTWDRFEVPLPFTTVTIAVGAPRSFAPTSEGALELACAIQRERARAVEACQATTRSRPPGR
ncbi:MAG TPA: lysophospholipid acyltransferase family protein [Polyangiaceae bacterium]